MSRKRYLLIVEKPSIAVSIARAYGAVKDDVDYNIDIAVANNFVFHLNDKYIIRANNVESMKQHPVLTLNTKQVDGNYHVMCNDDIFQKRGQHIKEMVERTKYAAIVNACDMDEPGELIFAYTIESLNLHDYQTARFDMLSLTETHLAQALRALHI